MPYAVVYDFATDSCRGSWLGVPAFAMALAALGCVLFYRRLPPLPLWGGRVSIPGALFGVPFFGLFAAITGGIFLESYSDYRALSRAVREGRDEVLEGTVDHVLVTGPRYHQSVELSVAGARFWFSENNLGQNGYHEIPPEALRPTRHVRLHYVGTPTVALGARITRVEVSE